MATVEQLQRRLLIGGTVGLGLVLLLAITGLGSDGSRDWRAIVATSILLAVGVAASVSRQPVFLPFVAFFFILTLIAGKVVEGHASRGSAAIALIILATAYLAFAPKNEARSIALLGALSFLGPLWWTGLDGLWVGIATGFAVSFIGVIIHVARAESRRNLERATALFESAPVGIMEQDWGAVLDWMEERRREGLVDLGAYLRAHPEEVQNLLERVDLVAVNAVGREMFGIGAEHPDHLEGERADESAIDVYIDLLADVYEGNLPREVIMEDSAGPGSSSWAQIRTFPVPGSRRNVIVVAVDITELKRAERNLEELVRSKDRFVASVSHELRTPLAAVVGFTSELVERPGMFDEVTRTEMLALARREAGEVADIIEDLLVAARADIGGVTVVHDVVDLEAELKNLAAMSDYDFPLELDANLPAVCGDATRVRQIFRNLMTNAHRYGGKHRRIMGGSDGRMMHVEVRDDGDAITEGELAAVFEPYVRMHEDSGITESVGLGLTVARHLGGVMGGSLVAFRDGPETVFRLELPVWGTCPARVPA